jgi:hypothetical protein
MAAVDKAVGKCRVTRGTQIRLAIRPDAMIRTKSEQYDAAASAAGRLPLWISAFACGVPAALGCAGAGFKALSDYL